MRDDDREALRDAIWGAAWRAIVAVAGVALAAWVAVQLQAMVVQVFLAIIVASGMAPLVDRMAAPESKRRPGDWRPPRAVAVLAIYTALVAVVALVVAAVVPPAARDVRDLVPRLPEIGREWARGGLALTEGVPFITDLDLAHGLSQVVERLLQQLANLVGQAMRVVQFAVGFLSGALNGVFVLILALYLTVDARRIRAWALGFLPPHRRPRAARIADHVGSRLGGWLRGQLLLSAIIGTVTLVGLLILGVPYAVLLAVIAGIGEAIPLVGPIMSAVPAVLVGLGQSPTTGLLVLALYLVIQQLENHLVVPLVMRRAVAIHPLAVILALLAGSGLMGITGAILAVPVAATIAVVIEEFRLAEGPGPGAGDEERP